LHDDHLTRYPCNVCNRRRNSGILMDEAWTRPADFAMFRLELQMRRRQPLPAIHAATSTSNALAL
jgi:hypothetical protein